ncbi:MAG: ABC transporter permease [Verrucomicrobiaceae bacterium]|nr:ABC transporter permease [Verrucomicrobiaceae bacterium]
MSPSAALQLAARYVMRHRMQSLLLSLALGAALALPAAVRVFAKTVEREMRARAAATPQVLGARGSALDLMLTALYYRRQPVEPVLMRQIDEVRATGFADAIPLHVRHHAQEAPIVGTELEYFSFRRLVAASGRLFTRLGDCVVGAHVARERGIKPGDFIFSSPEQVFDIAGIYPLKMRVSGVLAESFSPDDAAVFVDVKTAWLIEGRAHGHDDLAQADAGANVLKREAGNVVGNAAVRMFNEVTEANIGSFHFHGDVAGYPVTAAIVLPHDAKSEAILAGRYQDAKAAAQLIRPRDELDTVLSTLFRIEGAVVAGLALLACAAAAISFIVFTLSFKMRAREFATLGDIGIPPRTLAAIKAFEVALIGIAGVIVAAATVLLVLKLGPALVLRALR